MAEAVRLGFEIIQVALPLPIPGLPHVNAYLFPSPGGVTVIDPGAATSESLEDLGSALEGLGYGLGDIEAVVCTHLHPDHMGVATRLVEETGCSYVMHRSAADRMDEYNDWAPFRDQMRDTAVANGASEERADELVADFFRPHWAPPSMKPTAVVDDGQEISLEAGRFLTVVHTPGHDPSHVCLVDSASDALYSGDHVLPRITPFVPFLPEAEDNLGTYLDSLQRVIDIDPPVTCPAHGPIIERGAARARQIMLHHQRRLAGMVQFLKAGPAPAWTVMEAMFKPHLTPLHARFAFQETMAHLEHLRIRNRLKRSDRNGVAFYEVSTPIGIREGAVPHTLFPHREP